jgi:hypothetical protein
MLVALWRMPMRHARGERRRKEGAEGGYERLGTEGVEGGEGSGGRHSPRTAVSSIFK